MSLRNVGKLLPNYSVQHLRRLSYSHKFVENTSSMTLNVMPLLKWEPPVTDILPSSLHFWFHFPPRYYIVAHSFLPCCCKPGGWEEEWCGSWGETEMKAIQSRTVTVGCKSQLNKVIYTAYPQISWPSAAHTTLYVYHTSHLLRLASERKRSTCLVCDSLTIWHCVPQEAHASWIRILFVFYHVSRL
jgi:hypothetical protein